MTNGITLEGITFTNTDLPSATSSDDVIKADPDLLFWLRADQDFTTRSSAEILTFTDYAEGAATFAAQGASNRADLEDGQIAGYQAAHFETDQTTVFDGYVSSGLTLNSNQAFTFAAIVRFDTVGVSQSIVGRYASTTSRAVLQLSSANNPRILARSHFADAATTVAAGDWELIIGSFDGANTVRIWHRGAVASSALATSGDTSTGDLRLGTLQGTVFQAADMDLSDVIIIGRELLADMTGDTLQAIIDVAENVYGITVS